MPRRLFALDENFPYPILNGLRLAFDEFVELVSLRDIGHEFIAIDDWEVLQRLHQHERPWDGLITNDANMLALGKEMTVLSDTGLTLVVVKGQGDNPVRSTGLLLCHLHHICHQTKPGVAQVWSLSTAQKSAEPAERFLSAIAGRERVTVPQLCVRYRKPQ